MHSRATRAASALDHSNICTIHEIAEAPSGQSFIVMACYEGETLRDRIERGPLKLDDALDIAIGIGSALVAAHESGIVHRDIKPANVMLTRRGDVKVVDFVETALNSSKLTGAHTTSQPRLISESSNRGWPAQRSAICSSDDSQPSVRRRARCPARHRGRVPGLARGAGALLDRPRPVGCHGATAASPVRGEEVHRHAGMQWHLDRIDRYNGVYGAIETVFRREALAEAARQDSEATLARGARGPLWGVPIVIKANTSIKGQVTTAGWEGFTRGGHELVAPQDATVVAKFKTAGAIIVGHANMPDLANSDTNRSSSFGRTGNAYDVRFSPGGSSGGTVTAVAANMAVLGNGTDTGNSIRMPAATSALVGVFPTRGLVSIAGIAPLDWLLDNTGPIARTATDAAIALAVLAGADPLDPRTVGSQGSAQRPPYEPHLTVDALKGKRFGVPALVLAGDGIPFHGIPAGVPEAAAEKLRAAANVPLQPETREMFMKAVEALRATGAEVVFDDNVLPASFAKTASRVATYPYVQDGTNRFLAAFGPAEYHSAADYLRVVGAPLFPSSIGAEDTYRNLGSVRIDQRSLDTDPDAERTYHAPRRAMLIAYLEPLNRLKLDGYVYPAIQMPPPDETMPQNGRVSEGPHSATSWVNMIGVPAVVVPAGFYASGLPFGLEFSARPWTDGDLLAIAYAWEQATRLRKPPTLVERGLLAIRPAREPRVRGIPPS